MTWALSWAAALAPFALGFLVLSHIAPSLERASRFLLAGLSYGLGLVVLGWLSLVSSMLGYQLGGTEITLLVALLGLTLAWQRRRRDTSAPSLAQGGELGYGRATRALCLALVAWVAFRTALTVATCLLEPLVEWDVLAIWGFRAKVLSHETLLHTTHFESPHLAYSNLDYPLLWPFALSFVFKVTGSHDPTLIKALGAALTMAFAALFYGVASRRRDRVSALLAVAVLASIPMLQTQLLRMTADPPLAFLFFGAVSSTYLAVRDQEPELFKISGLFALGVILTKNEGLALWFVLFFSALLTPTVHWLKRRSDAPELFRRALWLGVLPAVLALPWLWFRATLPKLNVDYLSRLDEVTVSGAFGRIGVILQGWATYLGANADWLGVWILVAVVAVTSRERSGTGLRWLLATGVLPLVLYSGIYMVTPLGVAAHMEVSASRLGLHVLPVLLFFTFETLHHEVHWPWLSSPSAAARSEHDEPHPEPTAAR